MLITAARVVTVGLVALLVIYCIIHRNELTVDLVLQYTTENAAVTALIIIGFFALKSISIIFPLMVLYAAAGTVFPLWIAVIVNSCGLLVTLALPYFMGRFTGAELLDSLGRKYPRIGEILQFDNKNQFMLAFFLRQLGFLPADVVSMVCGSTKMNFAKYMLGSYVGMLPFLLASTLLGRNVTEPGSEEFIFSCVFIAVVSIISILICYFYKKRERRSHEH